MKVVDLQVENLQRIKVAQVTPTGTMVTIGGKNGQGKTSVLDAVWIAIKGRSAAPPVPVRKGEERCSIRLDLGELVISRTFTNKPDGTFTDSVKVENGEGLRYGKPQQVLDALLGELGFDPFRFTMLKPDKQAATLLEMVPLSVDLDEHRTLDTSDFAKRRDVNRDVAALAARIAALPVEDVPDDAPDRDALADQMASAARINGEIDREAIRRGDMSSGINATLNQAEMARQSAARLRREADEQEALAVQRDKAAKDASEALAALPALAEPVNAEAIRAELRTADATIAAIDRMSRRAALVAEHDAKASESQNYSEAMDKRERERTAALAKAKMPIPGLGLMLDAKGDPLVTLDGVPFNQGSKAQKLRASAAIAMSANPTLRILRIEDGSLLDEDSLALLAELAAGEDYQLWAEFVGTHTATGERVGFVMENGAIKVAGDGEPGGVSGADTSTGEDGAASPAPKGKEKKAAAAPKGKEKKAAAAPKGKEKKAAAAPKGKEKKAAAGETLL